MKECQQNTGCNCRANNTGHIGTHSMLEQVVSLVIFKSNTVRNAGSVGDSADTRVTDERVNLVTLFEEEVHELHEQDTEESGDDEGTGTEGEDKDRAASEECRCLCRSTDGDADEQSADVDDSVGSDIGETFRNTALLQQVTKEEHTQQGKA